eukprot:TRINITY_DN10941_c0_g1_i1.p1 TRINITY_DN10941_c0_g1~~TRINITY_DN10941_c0_g1_i1.p1  ORF type:complete len:163 (+),score=17.16 TRINITY_DN10941_c0_g1_i1:290-778(+)
MLYLPPFWFHHVKALSLSLSANVWSDSIEDFAFQQMFLHDYPRHLTDKTLSGSQRVACLAKYFRKLLSLIIHSAITTDFISSILQRYNAFSEVFGCDAKSFNPVTECPQVIEVPADKKDAILSEITKHVSLLQQHLKSFKHLEYAKSISELAIAEYVERLDS